MVAARSSTDVTRLVIALLAGYCLLVGVGALLTALGGSPVHVVLAPLAVAAAYGLWTRTRWGMGAAIALFAVEVVRSGLAVLAGDTGALLTVAFSLVIVWYLYRKRAIFG